MHRVYIPNSALKFSSKNHIYCILNDWTLLNLSQIWSNSGFKALFDWCLSTKEGYSITERTRHMYWSLYLKWKLKANYKIVILLIHYFLWCLQHKVRRNKSNHIYIHFLCNILYTTSPALEPNICKRPAFAPKCFPLYWYAFMLDKMHQTIRRVLQPFHLASEWPS